MNVAKANTKMNVTRSTHRSERRRCDRRPVGFDNELDGGRHSCAPPSVAHGGDSPVASMSETASPDPELFGKSTSPRRFRFSPQRSTAVSARPTTTARSGAPSSQREGRLVAIDGAGTPRRCRPRRIDPVRPRCGRHPSRQLFDPLVDCTNCNARHRLDKLTIPTSARPAGARPSRRHVNST